MISKKELWIIGISWLIILGLYGISRFYQLKRNVSGSMPQKLWLVHIGDKQLEVGDYVIFKFHDYRMQDKNDYEVIVKQIGGVAGDKIISLAGKNNINRVYLVGTESYPAFESLSGYKFSPLSMKNMSIPKGSYFVHGQCEPSFDSRYREFGLLRESQIIGKAYPIF